MYVRGYDASRGEQVVSLLRFGRYVCRACYGKGGLWCRRGEIQLGRQRFNIGVRDFGENRIQELERKAAALPEDIVWHFIGPLQSNKIRKAVKLASVIHSVEDIQTVERLDRIAGEEQRNVKFLIEVNVSGEASKGGVTPEEFMCVAEAAAKCRNACFSGLMTMAPLSAPQEQLDDVFSGLAALKCKAEKELGITLPILSMGMSGDYPNAIAAGSTIVRVGTAIFGKISAV